MATRLAHAALEVYEQPHTVEAMVHTYWGQDCEVVFFNVEATQCVLFYNHEEIVVCFRGSEQKLEDWVVDFEVSRVRSPIGGKVHEGFYTALSHVWSALNPMVQQLLRERPRRLFTTGHSLGGALATVAAAQWRHEDTHVDGVYTFGQPRVGDREFARNYDLALRSRSFRIVNHLDIVTRVPPRSVGYRHMSTLIYLDEHGKAQHGIQWWQRFLRGWCGAIENILDWCGEGVRDHSMTNYVTRLQSHAIAPPMRRCESAAVRSTADPAPSNTTPSHLGTRKK